MANWTENTPMKTTRISTSDTDDRQLVEELYTLEDICNVGMPVIQYMILEPGDLSSDIIQACRDREAYYRSLLNEHTSWDG